MERKRVLVAMSGGVDSAVCALLLKEQGYDCLGVHMILCPGDRESGDAARVCGRLGIPFEEADFTQTFRREVIGDFIRVYEAGGTPNPCVVCNRLLKFGALLDYALERGCDHIATGHYARVERNDRSGRYELKKAVYLEKDQSYVLARLTQDQLSRVIFPLGEMDKETVRAIAGERGFGNAHKKDSQDICFVPDGDYLGFLERERGGAYPPGDFVDLSGAPLGRHRGAPGYTLGQRKGLGLPMGERVYVCAKDMERNTVTVGPESALYSRALTAGEMNWISIPGLDTPRRLKARTRYNQTEREALASPLEDGRVRLDFDAPQRAVTPGQTLVLYEGETVVGGGVILEAESTEKMGESYAE